MTTKHRKFFISHSDKDSFIARVIAQKLESLGIDTSVDFENKTGEKLKEAIVKAIRESDAFVIVLTPDSIKNPRLLIELGAASATDKRIIPVVTGTSVEQMRENDLFLLRDIELIPIEQFYDQAEDFVPVLNG